MDKTLTAPQGVATGQTFARDIGPGNFGVPVAATVVPGSYDAEARTVEGVFAAGSAWPRLGFIETLQISPEAIDLSRVVKGQVKLLDVHNTTSITKALGSVEAAWVENGELVGRVRFHDTPQGREAEGQVARGEITGFSIGYVVNQWSFVSRDEMGAETWRAEKWTLLEVTLCTVPIDDAAMVRAVADVDTQPRNTPQEDQMTETAQPAAAAAAESPNNSVAATETRAVSANASAPPAPVTPSAEVETRAAPALNAGDVMLILDIASDLGQAPLARSMIERGATKEAILQSIRDARAAAGNPGATIGGPRAQIGRDETETRRRAIEDALAIQLGERAEPNEPARGFMRNRTLVEFAADSVNHSGRLSGFGEREDVLRRAMLTTSDFPILLENALNRALRARYVVAAPTYRAIAQQRTYTDFRDHITVRDGDFPQLKEVKETGEIQAGNFSESKEKTAVKAYAVLVPFSRQLLINDNLGAIQRVLNSRGEAVARFEEETFYAMMLSATGAGPTLNETSRAVFNTTDKTLAASGGAIDNTTLGAGRAAMRKRKTMDGTYINVSPSILLVGPDKETEAQSVLSPLYAAQASNVPLFSNLLSLQVTPQITGNAWYLFADPMQGANFEWGLLEGYAAPRMRIDEPFGRQGMSVSLEHDFGCGAIDFRFGYRNAGG
ncbi:HK97 family phage prohead protease [Methylocystis parvus]|uniref:phage major capsid protein n=1 Tax=Methylocystis parvus TaxID=134 RepID=UPI003C772751